MAWLDAIKDAVFTADPNAPQPAAAPAKAGAPAQPAAGTASAASYAQNVGVNPEFITAIKKAVFSKQTALTSLVEAAEKLANIIPDQATRYKAAYATAGNGRTVQQIAAAADIHMADVEGEELRFKAAVEGKLGQEANQHEQAAQTAGLSISAAQATIEQLARQLADQQARIEQLTTVQAEAAAAAVAKRSEMQLTADQFKAAAQVVRNEITTLRSAVVTSLS